MADAARSPRAPRSPRSPPALDRSSSRAYLDAEARPLLEALMGELLVARPVGTWSVRESVLRKVMAAGARCDESGSEGAPRSPGEEGVAAPLIAYAYNPALLGAVVEQPSPCCAAASVATCLGALLGQPLALEAVLEQYAQAETRRLEAVLARLERRVGARAGSLSALMVAELASAAAAVEAARALALRDEDPGPACRALVQLIDAEARLGGGSWPSSTDEQDRHEEREEEPGEEDHQEELVQSVPAGGGRPLSCQQLALQDLATAVKRRAGLGKLRRAKPSTGPVGNAALCAAVGALSAQRVRAETLLAASARSRLRLRKGDGPDECDAQWAALWHAFCRQGPRRAAALIVHIKNHYAPVYALRELRDGRRELLTARKGQHPREWVSFQELRCTLLGWAGYAVLRLELVDPEEQREPPGPVCAAAAGAGPAAGPGPSTTPSVARAAEEPTATDSSTSSRRTRPTEAQQQAQ
jgi:hypothetical protein